MIVASAVLIQIGTVVDVLVPAVLVLGAVGISVSTTSLVPSVWRGEKEPSPMGTSGRTIAVNERNLPVSGSGFSILFVGVSIGIVLGSLGILSNLGSTIGVALAVLGFGLVLVGVVISGFNGPNILVSPPHREETSWVTEWWRN